MAGAPAWLDITVVQNDRFVLTLEFTDAEGNPLDVSERSWKAQILQTGTGTPVDFAIDATEAVDGVIVARLTPSQTLNLGPGLWDLREFEGEVAEGGDTLLHGNVRVTPTVTR